MSGAPSLVAPGGTIGILGGGQLGRMTALAAANLGYRCRIYAPEADSPAAQVSAAHHRAAWDDETALAAFAASVDVVTYEFENVPASCVRFLSALKPVRPGLRALEVAQDRVAEKAFCASIGIPTATWQAVDSLDDLRRAAQATGLPAILKTRRDGYDGKGQARIRDEGGIEAAWDAIGRKPAILEAFVPFESELSAVVARGADGRIAVFPPGTNVHRDGILATTSVPAAVPAATRAMAEAYGARLAQALDVVGLIALELFATADGRLLANEMAPRPHNSGHWTMDACATSQFEQAVRAVCGLPLGPVDVLRPVRMENLIGADVAHWPEIVADPRAKLHLYGKGEIRPGRKMGHVNRFLG